MTNAEWLGQIHPNPMLELFLESPPGRKMLLFATACLRRVWDLIPEGRCRQAVEVAERLAESVQRRGSSAGTGSQLGADLNEADVWLTAAVDAQWQKPDHPKTRVDYYTTRAVYGVIRWCGDSAVGVDVAHYARGAVGRRAWLATAHDQQPETLSAALHARDAAEQEEAQHQCDLLRDIFGNPFNAVPLGTAWLGWNAGTISNLARPIYEDRLPSDGTLDPCRLAVLADALEDAGCVDPDILGHLRSPGPHVRGCWLVDLLLGKWVARVTSSRWAAFSQRAPSSWSASVIERVKFTPASPDRP